MHLRTLCFCLMLLGAAGLYAASPASPRIDTVQLLPNQHHDGKPDLIWYDDFNGSTDLAARYNEYNNDDGDFRVTGDEALGGAGQSLGGVFQQGEVSAGNIKKCFGRCPIDYKHIAPRPTEDFREVHYRYYLKMQDGWTGQPEKVSRACAFVAPDWTRAMTGYVWSGYSLNVKMDAMTRVGPDGEVTSPPGWNGGVTTWLGARESPYQIYDTAESGRWVMIETHIKFNTPGHSDGEQSLWIDGQLHGFRDDINWVYDWDDYGINCIFLTNYWNNGSVQLQERWFDDFVISTSPIGPATSPLNPRIYKTTFRDDDAGDTQSGWQLQLAWNADGTDVVWDSGLITGDGRSIQVTDATGAFGGGLAGAHQLPPDHLYALRVRQRDASGTWSDWAPCMTTLKTGDPSLGDADGDGIVDGGDLASWQQHYDPLGAPGHTFDGGDFNDDARVNGADLALWQQNYDPLGAGGLDGATSIPEPNTLVLLGTGLLAAVGLKRRFTPSSSRERQ